MTVPTLMNAVGSSPNKEHRILAALEGRVVQIPARARDQPANTGGGRKTAMLLTGLVLSAGLALYAATRDNGSGFRISTAPISSENVVNAPTVPVPALPEASVTTAAVLEDWPQAAHEADAQDQGELRNPLLMLDQAATPRSGLAGLLAERDAGSTRAPHITPSGTVPHASSGKPAPSAIPGRGAAAQKQVDVSVLAGLLSMGLPSSNLAGVQLVDDGAVRMRVIPVDQISARLQECDRQSFFQRPSCRAQVCRAHLAHEACLAEQTASPEP